MNIEIANRLVNLRKSNNLSQEALAEKLGISRQAVSKWERAEASPDTDNLILLARLYHVSLDELLRTEDEIPIPEELPEYQEEKACVGESDDNTERDAHIYFPSSLVSLIIIIAYLLVGCLFDAWHPGWLLFLLIPIWTTLATAIENRNPYYFAYSVLATLFYLCMGFFWDLWHPGWIVFLTVPFYYAAVPYAASWMDRKKEKASFYGGDKDGGTDEKK